MGFLQVVRRTFRSCSDPFAVNFNCLGMLVAGTLAWLGFLSYFVRYPLAVTEDTVLGPAATKTEQSLVTIGTVLFGAFGMAYTSVIPQSRKLRHPCFLCLTGLTAISMGASAASNAGPILTTHFMSRALSKNVVRYYGKSQLFDSMVFVVQSRLRCCGVGRAGYKDWGRHQDFRCSRANPSEARCAVPRSCCRNTHAARTDEFCGRGALNKTDKTARGRVYRRGCSAALVDIARGKMFVIGSLCVLASMMLALAVATRTTIRERQGLQVSSLLSPGKAAASIIFPYASLVQRHP